MNRVRSLPTLYHAASLHVRTILVRCVSTCHRLRGPKCLSDTQYVRRDGNENVTCVCLRCIIPGAQLAALHSFFRACSVRPSKVPNICRIHLLQWNGRTMMSTCVDRECMRDCSIESGDWQQTTYLPREVWCIWCTVLLSDVEWARDDDTCMLLH